MVRLCRRFGLEVKSVLITTLRRVYGAFMRNRKKVKFQHCVSRSLVVKVGVRLCKRLAAMGAVLVCYEIKKIKAKSAQISQLRKIFIAIDLQL